MSNNSELVEALVTALNRVSDGGNRRRKKNNRNSSNNQDGDYQGAKKSGAKYYKGRNGKQDFVGAWFWRRETGLIKISGFFEDDELHEASNGAEYVIMKFQVFYQNSGVTLEEKTAYFLESGKAHLPKSNIYISTNAANGGFCGFYSKEFKNHRPK